MIKVPYLLQAPVKGVKLLDGRFLRAFNNNIAFLKRFDIDRMLYWFCVNAGVPAPGAPYAAGDGHFENNLHGQTVGEFLMGAGTSLPWQEDLQLRSTVRALLNELKTYQQDDGYLVPVDRKTFQTKEYPCLLYTSDAADD